jgi:hypothetical protein
MHASAHLTAPACLRAPLSLPTGFPDIVEVGQQLQISRYLATGSEGVSLYLDVSPPARTANLAALLP